MKKFIRFLFSKVFWINVLILIFFVLIFFWVNVYLLDRFTQHGESVTVPDLLGYTIDDAEKQLENRTLRYQVMDSTYKVGEEPLVILEQDPKPGSKVKEDRKIYVTINAKNPPKTSVPDLKDISLLSAQLEIESKGLVLGDITYRPHPFHNTVLEMYLAEDKSKPLIIGNMLPKGSVIDLVVGDGLGNTTLRIPDLVGSSLEEALIHLKAKNLMEGSLLADFGVEDSLRAYVYKQEPAFDGITKIKEGTMIDLWIQVEPVFQRGEERIDPIEF